MKHAGREGFAGFPVLLWVGEGLAPPESPRARPGEPRAGQATAPTPVDWGCAVPKGSLRHGLRHATSLPEGGFFVQL